MAEQGDGFTAYFFTRINSEMKMEKQIVKVVQQRLPQAEIEHGVKIHYTCESGSRTRDCASPDLDFDVRFIYPPKRDWYMSFELERRRHVIEYPIVDDIDIGGRRYWKN